MIPPLSQEVERPSGTANKLDGKRTSQARRDLPGLIQEGSLYVLLFLLPFSKAAIEIGFGILLLAWGWARWDPRTRFSTVWMRPELRPLLRLIVAFLGVGALSIAVSTAPLLSLSGLINKWLEYLLFFVIVADLGRRPAIVRRSLTVMAWSSCLVVVEVATQKWFGHGFFRGYPYAQYGRITGPYENPIDLATYLIVVILLLVGYAASGSSIFRRFLWGVTIPLLVILALTKALGAWLAFGIGLLAMIGLSPSIRRAGTVLLAALGIGAVMVLQYAGELKGVLSLSEAGKADRLIMWQAALRMIHDRPLLGLGLNTFMDNYLRYRVGGELWPRYAHNCYLQMAAETGIIGLIAFVGLLGTLFARFFAGLRRTPVAVRPCLAGFVGALLAFAVQAGYDTNFYALRQVAMFWILAGLALGMSERSVQDQSPELS